MNKTAIVYSKEEALSMKPADRPMCYRVPGNIYHDAASITWRDIQHDDDSTKEDAIEAHIAELMSFGESWDEISARAEAERVWNEEQLQHLKHV